MNREAFEAWFNSEMPMESLITDQDNDYKYQPAIASWEAWQAALASQAQQPSIGDALWGNKALMALNADLGLSMDKLVKVANAILQSQAQQESQWISVEERLPELSNRELIVRLKPKRKNTKIVEYRIAVYNKPCEWEEPVFWCVASEEDVEVESWFVMPPAPEGTLTTNNEGN